MAGRVQNQVALVTGGASGLGRAVSLMLATEGAIIAVYDRNAAGADATRQEIEAAGGRSIAIIGDTTSESDAARGAAAAAELGPIDVLVNCAGITGRKKLLDMTPEIFRSVLDVNLTGYWMMIRACLPHMRRGSRVVSIASIAGHLGYSDSAYGASKAGVLGLTKQLAKELAAYGVRINSVSPGVIYKTKINADALDVPAVREDALAHTPIGRLGKPDDVARAILFLASEDSDFVTGADLLVDGGMGSYIGRIDAAAAMAARATGIAFEDR